MSFGWEQCSDSITYPVLWCSLTFFFLASYACSLSEIDGNDVEKNACRAEREPIVRHKAGKIRQV